MLTTTTYSLLGELYPIWVELCCEKINFFLQKFNISRGSDSKCKRPILKLYSGRLFCYYNQTLSLISIQVVPFKWSYFQDNIVSYILIVSILI
jgi:hypothetical protein